ncbi:MAG: D-alanyl-D-alanine carboxypeptidase [Alphaproteobacteria bacterium]|nr:D-alanyl-D-alanine carboxypeptidase [Alphaproteobacteria bacterium]OJV15734.1 MAG: hypothetical protein BGO27_07450 [Alphaproteobacteria bacterium 33-17]
MVNKLLNLIALVATLLIFCASSAFAFEKHKYAALVVDQKTGKILYEENATQHRYPASITKVMTLYLTFEAIARKKLDVNQDITVSKHAASMPKMKLGLKPGSKIKLRDAIYAAVVKSSNDAAVVLAEAVAGSEHNFVKLMNKRAKDLGMKHTTYANASGLPNPTNKSSAYDIAKIAIAIERDYPEYFKIFQTKEFNFKGKKLTTTNNLLAKYKYEGVTGLKTGFTNMSGYNLVTTVKRGDRKLVAVVLGGSTGFARDRKMMALLDKFLGSNGSNVTETIIAKKSTKKQPKQKVTEVAKAKIKQENVQLNLASAKVSEKRIKAVRTKLSDNHKQNTKKNKIAQN